MVDRSPTLLLVDGHSLAFRAYYAFAKSRDGGLRTSTGIPTSVCFGFLQSLLDVIATEEPEYVAIAFDRPEPTFRHQADPNYKAQRPETPEDFITDTVNLQRLLAALNFEIVTAPGYEADDVLATLARQATEHQLRSRILSGDKDLFQLVDSDKDVTVLYLSGAYGQRRTGKPTAYDPEKVREKLGVTPAQVVDFKSLCGDKSDNIPGVTGIGEKTAAKLLDEYGTLEGIYNNIDKIKGANRRKLEAGKQEAWRSRDLVQIVCDVPLSIDLDELKLQGFDEAAVVPLLAQLEFKDYLKKLPKLQAQLSGKPIEAPVDVSPDIAEDSDTWFFSAEDTQQAQQQQIRTQIRPQIVDTPEKLSNLVDRLQNQTSIVAWDTETTALDPRDATLVGIGCCWGSQVDEMAYIPIFHSQGKTLNCDLVIEALRPILESENYPKLLQNAKFDRSILRAQGIELQGVIFDTMLASYLLNPEQSHNLSDLAFRYLGIVMENYSDLVPKQKTIADIDIADVAVYCGNDVYATYQLYPLLQAELANIPDLDRLNREVELPLEPVLADMEYRGIKIDVPYLQDLSNQLATDLQEIESRAYREAGETFNLDSPKQLSHILFETLQLDKRKSRKTKTGYSTNAAVLEKLHGDHPLIDSILEHRTLAKLRSTYVDALPELVRSDTGRIHTDFNQAITATGRLSSSHPNLQNIPIRTAFSRQIRRAFIPEPGWFLAAADYSQIELRILAHLSQEPVLIEAYQNNRDVHRLTAQLLFEKEEVTPEERRLGKTINFGVIYGMGAQRFAREAGASTDEGKKFIKRYNDRYAKVFAYLQKVKREAIARGYVSTILGRRRYFNFESSRLRQLRDRDPQAIDLETARKSLGKNDSQWLRAAANAPIQGSSADIIKIAMVRLHDLLSQYEARLLLQVHDELVFEVPPSEWEVLQPQIRSTMEDAIALSVPLVVDVRAGDNWMEAK